jgi:hypothetical protein
MRANQQRLVCSAAVRYFRAPERSIRNSTLDIRWHTLSFGPSTSDPQAPRADSHDLGVSRGPYFVLVARNQLSALTIRFRTMVKFGLFLLATGALVATASLSKAGTPDPANPFTKHWLPVPGAYFKSKETPPPAAVAASSSEKSGATPKQTAAKATKKQTKHIRYATS